MGRTNGPGRGRSVVRIPGHGGRTRSEPADRPAQGLRSVPVPGRILILLTEAATFGALIWGILGSGFGNWSGAGIFALLAGTGLVCSPAGRVIGVRSGVVQDFHSVWLLPMALLLPAPYVILGAIADRAWTQWRIRRTARYLQIFNAAAIGLSHFCAGRLFAFMASEYSSGTEWLHETREFFGCVVAAVLCRRIVNSALIRSAAVLAVRSASWRSIRPDRETLIVFGVEGAESVCSTVLIALNPLFLVVIAPPVVLLHRALIHNQLAAAARIDTKTGLLNAGAWRDAADDRVRRVVAGTAVPAVMLMDLDHFKRVNDTYGHLAGDAVLAHVAEVLRGELRSDDVVGRFGGEEFVTVAAVNSADEAMGIAERIRSRVAASPLATMDGEILATISIGVAIWGPDGHDVLELLGAADVALYSAKFSGRNRSERYRPGQGMPGWVRSGPSQPAHPVRSA